MRLSQYIGDFHPEAHVKGCEGCSFTAFICSRNSATFNAISSSMTAQKYKVFINDNVIFLDEKSFREFCARFTIVQAAGGLVKNNSDEYLFIFRRGKWDLPKGKADKNETPQQTALREVQEECGLNDLEIVSGLPATYHSYPEKQKNILKHTYWFLMTTS